MLFTSQDNEALKQMAQANRSILQGLLTSWNKIQLYTFWQYFLLESAHALLAEKLKAKKKWKLWSLQFNFRSLLKLRQNTIRQKVFSLQIFTLNTFIHPKLLITLSFFKVLLANTGSRKQLSILFVLYTLWLIACEQALHLGKSREVAREPHVIG